jgi:hypothetical protein
MTQTMFAPPPVEEQVVAETPGSRRTALVVGAAVAALALAGGGYVLLSGGSSEPAPAALPVHHVAVKPKAVKPAVKPAAQVPPTSSAPIGRDPFHALYLAPVAAANTGTAPSTSTGSTTTPGTSGDTTTPVAASYTLTLVKVTGGTNGTAPIFTWNVGGTVKQVLAAQKFGKYGELVTLTFVKSSTNKVVGAVVQVGDDEPVGVKVGEKITVK